jgi:hypothetical protein
MMDWIQRVSAPFCFPICLLVIAREEGKVDLRHICLLSSLPLQLKLLRQMVDWQLSYVPAIKDHLNRSYKLAPQKKTDRDPTTNPLIVEPLGLDRKKRRYWVFDDSARVYTRFVACSVPSVFATVFRADLRCPLSPSCPIFWPFSPSLQIILIPPILPPFLPSVPTPTRNAATSSPPRPTKPPSKSSSSSSKAPLLAPHQTQRPIQKQP